MRRVGENGFIRWAKQRFFLSTALSGDLVRLVPHDEEPLLSVIYYGELVGRLDLRQRLVLGPDAGALPRTPEFGAWRPLQEVEDEGEAP